MNIFADPPPNACLALQNTEWKGKGDVAINDTWHSAEITVKITKVYSGKDNFYSLHGQVTFMLNGSNNILIEPLNSADSSCIPGLDGVLAITSRHIWLNSYGTSGTKWIIDNGVVIPNNSELIEIYSFYLNKA